MELRALEGLGDNVEGRPAQARVAGGVREQVARPVGVLAAGRDEQAPVRLLNEADGNLDLSSARPPPCLESKDLAPAGKLLCNVVRYRLRPCQDLPSVCTAGA